MHLDDERLHELRLDRVRNARANHNAQPRLAWARIGGPITPASGEAQGETNVRSNARVARWCVHD
jgi:hypothetical protein